MSRSFRNTAPTRPHLNNKTLGIIIPCAGYSEKMRSYGQKSTIQITETQTLLGRQIDIFRSLYPDGDITVVVGYEHKKITKLIANGNIRVVENENYEKTNVVRSICLALRVLKTDSVLISYGDLVFSKPDIIGLVGENSKLIINNDSYEGTQAGINIVNGKAVSSAFGLDNRWCQMLFLAPKELKIARKLLYDDSNNTMLGFELINYIIDKGGDIETLERNIIDIDCQKDIKRVSIL